jgi:two-component system, chemotaxis family, protein-glutamate methylesterase/glutaminase
VAAKTRVLIVDDSAVVRKLIADRLRQEPNIEVVGGAADPYVARDLILQHKPDLLTLDIEMPRMDGLTFLKKLMAAHPLPVIIVSSVTQSGSHASIEALRSGAIDVIAKPGGPHSVGQVTNRIAATIKGLGPNPVVRVRTGAALAAPAAAPPPVPVPTKRHGGLILIGASTGGTQAIEAVLTRLPADMPPILIVQHMPAHFTKAFAERLDQLCALKIVEAQADMVLERGTVYIAPGDYHMTVARFGLQLRTALNQGEQVHHQRPAVDVLFKSACQLRGVPMVAMLLTGMGADGADGMVMLRQVGAETIAEDEQSCVVFGMPKEAIARGGAMHVSTLLKLPSLIFECLERVNGRKAA